MRPKGQIFDLKTFRDDRKLTQKEISEAVKRPQSFLSAIEHGKRSAPPGFLDDLTRLYDVDNISDYIHDRPVETFGSVKDVKDSIVNSPGGMVLVNEFGNKLTPTEIKRVLEIQETAWREKMEEEGKETSEIAPSSPPATPPPSNDYDQSNVTNLVNLLTDAENRYKEAVAKIKELEGQVKELQAQLPKKKR